MQTQTTTKVSVTWHPEGEEFFLFTLCIILTTGHACHIQTLAFQACRVQKFASNSSQRSYQKPQNSTMDDLFVARTAPAVRYELGTRMTRRRRRRTLWWATMTSMNTVVGATSIGEILQRLSIGHVSRRKDSSSQLDGTHFLQSVSVGCYRSWPISSNLSEKQVSSCICFTGW